MRIALTTWQERIAPVFDVAREVTICDADETGGRALSAAAFVSPDPSHRARSLAEWGVERLVCGAISRCAEECVRAQGIEITPFVAGPSEAILEACLDGSMNAANWAMPGCRRGGGQGRRRRRGQGRCRYGQRVPPSNDYQQKETGKCQEETEEDRTEWAR